MIQTMLRDSAKFYNTQKLKLIKNLQTIQLQLPLNIEMLNWIIFIACIFVKWIIAIKIIVKFQFLYIRTIARSFLNEKRQIIQYQV